MKNILKNTSIFILCVSLIALSSCNKFLDIAPRDSQNTNNYYTTESAIYANTGALYSMHVWQGFALEFMWLAGDLYSGDEFYHYGDQAEFFNGNFGSANGRLTNGWNGLYDVISVCNDVINNMPEKARANDISEDVIFIALGEAHCIRGIAYYILAEYWNDVPIITDSRINKDEIVLNTQKSVYEFSRRDLVFADENLPITAFQAGRCTRYTAKGMLAKLHLTMASHLDDAESAANFELAKTYAADVINNSGLNLYPNLEKMFYPEGNNNEECLFAVQCINAGYGEGNVHNAHHSRTSRVNLSANAWGEYRSPTLSLQEAFETGDARRANTFMRQGDNYNNLGGGGYSYNNCFPLDADKFGDCDEKPCPMMANVRKYVIGSNGDCGGKAGGNQDAGNNLYFLRLADVYLIYVEACIGAGVSTSDALAIDVFKKVRGRANLQWNNASITFEQLIKERRTEFALEGINFFDIKRMSYRNMGNALAYLTDMHRERRYVWNESYFTPAEFSAANLYHGGFTPVETVGEDIGGILTITTAGTPYWYDDTQAEISFIGQPGKLKMPIPDATMTLTPNLNGNPVDYEF